MKLLLASRNEGKIREIKTITEGRIEIISPLDLSLEVSILENGRSLKANAIKKALTYHKIAGMCTLGEDTGLEVDFLGGEPGVHSARYTNYGDVGNREKLLKKMGRGEERTARFRTVMALVLGEDWVEFFEGTIEGKIALEEKGSGGFGYDSIFIPAGYRETFAEMDEAEKNRISHRGKALKKVFGFLEREWEKLKDLCK